MTATVMLDARRRYSAACEDALGWVIHEGCVEVRDGAPVLVVPLSRGLSDALAALGCEFEDLENEGAVPGAVAA